MKTKLFEIRDDGTFIPVMATEFNGNEAPLFKAAGYGPDRCVIVTILTGGNCSANYDPYGWPSRTMIESHRHIEKQWDNLESGDVIDVQFITGKTPTKKPSQCAQMAGIS